MKKLLVICMIGALLAAGTGCGNSETEETHHVEIIESTEILDSTDDISAQLQLIADNKDMWYVTDAYEPYFYTVTDLDENGRLELIASSCQGSGIYTYSSFYEVSEDKSSLSKCAYHTFEEETGPDIIKGYTTRYRSDGNLYYQFVDVTRASIAEQYASQNMLYLNNGNVSYFVFASEVTEADAAGNVTTTYYDANGNILDESAYLDKCQNPLEVAGESVALYWSDLSEGELLNTLTEAYETFAGMR